MNPDFHFGHESYEGTDQQHIDVSENDRRFYSQIPKKLIEKLYHNIYKSDFEMLGYEYPQEYIDMGYDGDVK